MFSLSTKSDYGLLLLTLLAKRKDNKVVPLSELAKETQLPYSFLSRIASELAGSGILISKEGIKGGYKLAKKPEKIRVAKVIEVLDGSWSPTKCSDKEKECKYENICPMAYIWQNYLKQKILQLLNSYTVKDLMN